MFPSSEKAGFCFSSPSYNKREYAINTCLSAMILLRIATVLYAFTSSSLAVKQILSFGGNGLIGSEVLTSLIKDGDYNITLVSRGSWPFDAVDRIMPHVNDVVCDRNRDPLCKDGQDDCDMNTIHHCRDLWNIINETEHFDAVLDFSGYQAKWVEDAISALGDKVGVYVYVSSDSVYDVSEPKATQRPSVESDAVRPRDKQKMRDLNEADGYGDAKLAGEEILRDQRQHGGVPWVALRFSDVVGPRDTTYRWPLYQLWVTFYHEIDTPIFVPESVMNVKESLTYVQDAAQSILLAMNKPESWDNAYNIAFEREFSLWDILQLMGEVIGVEGMKQDNEESEKSIHLYPTVFSGPQDISKAKDKLGFVPTEPEVAFRNTVAWYKDLFINNEDEREELIARFMLYVLPREAKQSFYVAVGKELERHGIRDEKYRKKRKGDLGDINSHGEPDPEEEDDEEEEEEQDHNEL